MANKNNTFADFLAKIEKSNAEFNALSKPQKRVRIAEDVIQRLNFNNIKAHRLNFALIDVDNVGSSDSLKNVINSEASCQVCAKGALFCSFVGRVNDFTVGSYLANQYNNVNDKAHDKLQEVFTLNQLCLIETAFEGTQFMEIDISDKEIYKAIKFYERYDGVDSRLRAICENIICNKGTFKP